LEIDELLELFGQLLLVLIGLELIGYYVLQRSRRETSQFRTQNPE